MAQDGKKKNQGLTPFRMSMLIVAVVFQFIGLFFMCIGSPYDQLKITDKTWKVQLGDGGDVCYSVWGTKRCGGAHAIAWHDEAYYAVCGVFEATLKAAAAFTLIAIAMFVIGIAATFMVLCKCVVAKIPLILITLFGVVASAVPFAAIAGLYHNSQCNTRFKDIGKFQPGFPFFIVSWCMEVITFIFVCVA